MEYFLEVGDIPKTDKHRKYACKILLKLEKSHFQDIY